LCRLSSGNHGAQPQFPSGEIFNRARNLNAEIDPAAVASGCKSPSVRCERAKQLENEFGLGGTARADSPDGTALCADGIGDTSLNGPGDECGPKMTLTFCYGCTMLPAISGAQLTGRTRKHLGELSCLLFRYRGVPDVLRQRSPPDSAGFTAISGCIFSGADDWACRTTSYRPAPTSLSSWRMRCVSRRQNNLIFRVASGCNSRRPFVTYYAEAWYPTSFQILAELSVGKHRESLVPDTIFRALHTSDRVRAAGLLASELTGTRPSHLR
jgi:hypothetical protein